MTDASKPRSADQIVEQLSLDWRFSIDESSSLWGEIAAALREYAAPIEAQVEAENLGAKAEQRRLADLLAAAEDRAQKAEREREDWERRFWVAADGADLAQQAHSAAEARLREVEGAASRLLAAWTDNSAPQTWLGAEIAALRRALGTAPAPKTQEDEAEELRRDPNWVEIGPGHFAQRTTLAAPGGEKGNAPTAQSLAFETEGLAPKAGESK